MDAASAMEDDGAEADGQAEQTADSNNSGGGGDGNAPEVFSVP
jgi:hypothetical protein